MKKVITLILMFFTLITFSQPGSLDLGFDVGSGFNYWVNTTLIQPDGKILVGGDFTSYNGIVRNRIARLNPDGSLDLSFDTGDLLNSSVYSIARQTDGKIILGGAFTKIIVENDIVTKVIYRIVRLNLDGSIDYSFKTDPGADYFINAIQVQPDGKILIAGKFSIVDGISRSGIARLNSDGSLDTSFNPENSIGGFYHWLDTMFLLPNGKILIGGIFSDYNGTPRNSIAQLNSDGSLDTSLDPGSGINGSFRHVYSINVQTDSKILLGGSFTDYNGIERNRIVRINPNGSLDSSFNPGLGADNHVYSVLLQTDGKIIISGWFSNFDETPRQNVARLNSDGSLDTVFNPGSGAYYYVNTSSIQTDGKIILGGRFESYDGVNSNFIARVNVGISPPFASNQSFCTGATVSNLVATGSNLQWYATATVDTALTLTTILTSNTYYVSQTIDGIESSRTEVLVIVNPLPVVSVSSTNVLCSESPTGSITASVTSGTIPYSYSLNGGLGQASGIFNNITAGTHIVTVTDGNGCQTNSSVIITEPSPIILETSQVNPICNGSSGTINFSATGGIGKVAYIANSSNNTVTVLNRITNLPITTISVGNTPHGVSVTPNGNFVYVTNPASNTVSVINTNTNTIVSTISVGANPFGIRVTPDGSKVFVANSNSNNVSVINTSTNSLIATIPVGSYPAGVAISPNGNKVYVGNRSGGSVSIIDVTTNLVVNTVSSFGGPWGIAISPDNTKYYVVCYDENSLKVVNTDTNSIIATIAFGKTDPFDVVLNPSGTKAYVGCLFTNRINVVNTLTNTVESSIPVGNDPFGLSYDESNDKLYSVNAAASSLSIINALSNTVASNLTGFNTPTSWGNFLANIPAGLGTMTYTINGVPQTTSSFTGPAGVYTVVATDANNCSVSKIINLVESCYTAIPDANFEQALIDLGYDTVIDGQVLTSNINGITDLTVSNRNIQDLTGIRAFTNLINLDCSANQIVNLDVSGLTSLEYLYTRASQLTNINLSGLTSLKYLYCNYNNLSSLTVVNLPSLLTINCEYNVLTSLTLGGLTSLDKLFCQFNQLSSMDLNGGLPVLTVLNCTNNQLNSLDANNLTELQELYCQYNQLTSLNINNATSVKIVYCFLNQLTSLDVSGLAQMHTLECSHNNITNLNFAGCVGLQGLYCNYNQLTSIDVSGLPILGDLFCMANQLININVHGVTSLTLLLCNNNQLSSLDLTGLTLVRGMDCSSNPNLSCIQVSDVSIADSTSNWIKDNTATYSRVCPPIALPQTFCYGAKVSNLIAQGTLIKWYLDASGGTKLATTTTLTSRTYYVTQTINGIESDRTAVAVTINPKSVAGTISASAIICEGNAKTLTLSSSHVGTVQWQSSNESTTTGFTNVVGATANSYTTNPLFVTTYFRSVVTSGVCSSATATAITITVSPSAIAGTVLGGGVTVCKASTSLTAPVNNSTTLSLSGFTGSTLVWKKSATLNGTYSTISGATQSVYAAINLTATTYYKVEVKSGACSVTTEPVVINVSPTSVAGIISAAATICYNTSKTLTLSTAHVGTIQWQMGSFLEGPYSDIIGETGTTLNTGNLTSSTYYRVAVTSGICSSVYAKPIKITVSPQSIAGIISGGGITVCPGINSTILTLSGYAGKIQWQSSIDNNFATPTILTGTTSTYIAKNLTSPTYFRAVVNNGATTCIPAITEPILIDVSSSINAGFVMGTDTICSGTSATLLVTGFENGATIQWQKASTLNGTYSNVITGIGFNTANYITPALTTTTYYKAKISYNGCYSTTNGFTITVQKAIAGSISTIASVCLNTPSSLNLNGYSGTSFQWFSSPNSTLSNFTPIEGATSTSYPISNNDVGTTYYLATVSYIGCTPVFTPITNVNVTNCLNPKQESSDIFNAIGYPNPFGETFMLKISTTSQETINIVVYDIFGKSIEKKSIVPSDVSSLLLGDGYPTGIYNVVVNQCNELKTFRIVKK